MGNLEHRVSRLEERAGISGAVRPLVWLIEFVGAKDGKPIPPGELLGVEVGREREMVTRPDGESEGEFIERIKGDELAKVKGQRHPVVVMYMIRSDEASENAKP